LRWQSETVVAVRPVFQLNRTFATPYTAVHVYKNSVIVKRKFCIAMAVISLQVDKVEFESFELPGHSRAWSSSKLFSNCVQWCMVSAYGSRPKQTKKNKENNKTTRFLWCFDHHNQLNAHGEINPPPVPRDRGLEIRARLAAQKVSCEKDFVQLMCARFAGKSV
jgi:hypothetical protein